MHQFLHNLKESYMVDLTLKNRNVKSLMEDKHIKRSDFRNAFNF